MELGAIRLIAKLKTQLPACNHLDAIHHPLTSIAAKCLLNAYCATSMANLMQASMRI